MAHPFWFVVQFVLLWALFYLIRTCDVDRDLLIHRHGELAYRITVRLLYLFFILDMLWLFFSQVKIAP